MSKDGNPGCNSLTNMLGSMMAQTANKPLVLDFGIICDDYSLQTNTFPKKLKKDEYSVCRCVTYDPKVPLTQTYFDGSHSHPDASPPGLHRHDVELPFKMYWLLPGDRVLVACRGHRQGIQRHADWRPRAGLLSAWR